MSVRGRIAAAAIGAGTATLAYRWLTRTPPGSDEQWTRVNHRGENVTLLEGPALVAAAGVAAAVAPGLPHRLRTAAALAAIGAGALGAYDDLAGSSASRGLRGHLGALAKGEVTTGAVKILGIGATGLVAGSLIQKRPLDKLLAGIVVAGSANVMNLFDLRPGRAIKVGLAAGLPTAMRSGGSGVLAAGPLGASAVLLPADLQEKSMLGDAGSNALGAVLGVASAARSGRAGLLLRAAVLVGLTLASEKVSFTKVIAATPPLNALDMLGRRPPAQAPAQPPDG
jgi:UDP-N-acetylmuramyl pentapeptide phosphotransferase/UDP-N-acetylglucosamine-1-phosphate transferase